MSNRLHTVSAICLATLVFSGCGQEDRPDPAFATGGWPNVLLITVDSVRADHLHCYGYGRKTSPQIDQLAADGALFEAAISASPWSLPTHVSLFTSLIASIHGCQDGRQRLPQPHTTLAEVLRSAGFATAGFVSNPYLDPVFGLSQGFDDYVDCGSAASTEGASENDRMTSPATVAAVQGWLQKNTRRPFFMFVNFWDAHFDYTPPAPFDAKFDPDYAGNLTGAGFMSSPRINPDMAEEDLEHVIALYDGEIAWVDLHVGAVLEAFRNAGLLDSTIVILTSSHGTAFFEHKLKGHRHSLYDETIRVPLIIRWPGRVPAGQRYPEQARSIDIFPTITNLLGMPPLGAMGRSLAPLFVGKSIDVRGKETAVSEVKLPGDMLAAYRQRDRKTIFSAERNGGSVYDLTADPGELAALTDRESPTVRAARADTYWSRNVFPKEFLSRYPAPKEITELPARVLERLNALGYVDGEPPRDMPAPDAP